MGTMVSGSGVYGQGEEAGTEAKYSHQIECVVRGGKTKTTGVEGDRGVMRYHKQARTGGGKELKEPDVDVV